MRKFLFLMFSLCISLSTLAHDFESGGIYYNITSLTDKTVSVTYQGSSSFSKAYSRWVTIPSSVTYNGTTYSVTSIGRYAFEYCSGLTSVTIPDSVMGIDEGAFADCSGLTSVTIGNSVTSIGDGAFAECRRLFSVTIPNSVTSIGIEAFRGCTWLTSVTMGNSVTSIGDAAFYGCTRLPVENNVRYADTYLVGMVDEKATSVTIKDGTRFIGSWAFYDCSGLTSVTIPNSVTSIGICAFDECSGLTSVTIGSEVKSIGIYAFCNCPLREIYVAATVPPSIEDDTFMEYSAALYVPKDYGWTYFTTPIWQNFTNLEEWDAGVTGVKVDSNNAVPIGYYDLNGVQYVEPQQGVNIVCYSDGTTKKVIIRQ